MKKKTFLKLSLFFGIFLFISMNPVSAFNPQIPHANIPLSISGRVTDGNGNGVEGVTITLLGGWKIYLPSLMKVSNNTSNEFTFTKTEVANITSKNTVVTDSNGNYIINDVSPGKYELIPSKVDSQFIPQSRNLILMVTGSAINQNFQKISFNEMVMIPAGNFQMGCNPLLPIDPCSPLSDEVPVHEVYLDTFYIDKYEVTNGQFNQCVLAGNCTAPANYSSYTRTSYFDNLSFINYPVIYVDWYQAKNYCDWVGKRLPTEAEWEKAARGSVYDRRFPWGNDLYCNFANYTNLSGTSCVGDTTAIGSYLIGISPYGVHDMSGNVWEWINDWYMRDYYFEPSAYNNPTGPDQGTYRVIRGGSWFSFYVDIRVANRAYSDPTSVTNTNGFRCASTYP